MNREREKYDIYLKSNHIGDSTHETRHFLLIFLNLFLKKSMQELWKKRITVIKIRACECFSFPISYVVDSLHIKFNMNMSSTELNIKKKHVQHHKHHTPANIFILKIKTWKMWAKNGYLVNVMFIISCQCSFLFKDESNWNNENWDV